MNAQAQHYADKLAFEIDSWDLSVALAAGERVVVIDARAPEAFAREHIPGAINVPHRAMREDPLRAVDRDALVVTYCDGIGCNASTKGALNMSRLGFRVKELIGGLDWWKRDGHPTHGETAQAAGTACGCNEKRSEKEESR
jgi:rhodanese-related sulfurtransferase